MKTKLALSLIVAAFLPACTTTKTTSTTMSSDAKASRYANNSMMEAAPPAEGPEADIPTEGPADVNINPAYVPTPLLRGSAAASP